MVNKKVIYTTSDGKEYKTEASAKKHEAKLIYSKKLAEKGWTKEEFQSKIEAVADRNPKIKALLTVHKKWENFPPHLIVNILDKSDSILDTNLITKFITEKKVWGDIKVTIIAEEKGPTFADENMHCKQEFTWDDFAVKEVRQKNEFTKEVVLENKYNKYEVSAMKLKAGIELDSDEISSLLWSSDVKYQEEGENGRWNRNNLSVIDLEGTLYAIEWSEGLTESQENEFYTQPYKVELEKRDIVVTKTFVNKI